MAYNGHQSTFTNSLFPTYQLQASASVGSGSNRNTTVPFVSVPSVSLQEKDTTSCVPWPHNTHDDPYELINFDQSSIKNRKPSDCTDYDGETDLQSLVSNILDEADSRDRQHGDGNLNPCNPVWSPNILKEELLQYFQSEAKMQHNSTFPPNYVSHEGFSKAQGQLLDKDAEEFCPQFNGLATSQQRLFNLPNGDLDNSLLCPQKLPPGLPVPNKENTYMSQIQQRKSDNTQVEKERGNSQTVNNFPVLNDVFRPQSEMNSSCFDPYYEDFYIQSRDKPVCNEQNVPQDINQLVRNFQSYMAFCHRDNPNMQQQSFGMPSEDGTSDQWKITSPTVSTQNTPAMQTQKQLVGDFGVQRGRSGGVRKQLFQDLPVFNSQNTEYLQQPEPFPTYGGLPSQYQNKMGMQKEAMNVNMTHYPNHNIQQGQVQNMVKPQMQKEKMMHMSGFVGKGSTTTPLTNTHMRKKDKKQVFSQNPYFDLQGGIQTQRFDVENSIFSAGNLQQCMPLTYPVSDPRGRAGVPINSHFSVRSMMPYGGNVPGSDVCDLSGGEFVAFNSFNSDVMTHRGEMMTTRPTVLLYSYLDKCYDQCKCLEKERKRAEVILTKTFPGKRTSSVTNSTTPRTPPNPTRVDNLIVKQIREQAKVESLLQSMECLRQTPLHINIYTALHKHHMAISITQTRRKEEIVNMSKHQRQRAHFTDDRDILLLAITLRDLEATTRQVRTALFCALQMTLPKPVRRQEHQGTNEATAREGCLSVFEGYSYSFI